MITSKMVFHDEYTLVQLKRKISEATGFVPNTKSDCYKLSELIQKSGAGYISASTLYRLFFHIGKHKPYKHTIDLLSKYLGYKGCDDLIIEIKKIKEKLSKTGTHINGDIRQSLLYNCIETSSYKAMYAYFDSIKDETENFKEHTGIHLYDCLRQSSRTKQFFTHFSSHKFVREYLLEKAHDPKFRIKHYDAGYHFYLKETNKLQNIGQFQDFIFANCVLFRHYFINHKYKECVEIGQKLYRDNDEMEKLKNALHFFPYCRYIAYKIWFLNINDSKQKNIEEYAEYLLSECALLKSQIDTSEKRILFNTISEAFIYSNLSLPFHQRLKEIFSSELQMIIPKMNHKRLQSYLHYFEPNGLIYHRP